MAVSIAGAQLDAACGSGPPVGDCISRHKRPLPPVPARIIIPSSSQTPSSAAGVVGTRETDSGGTWDAWWSAIVRDKTRSRRQSLDARRNVVLHDLAAIVGGCFLETRSARVEH